jgi:hypothetical protein
MIGRRNKFHIVQHAKMIVFADILYNMEPYPDQKEERYRTDWQWVHYLFHLQVRRSHEIWEKEWTTRLDKIDQCIKVNVWRRRGSFIQLRNNHPSHADFFLAQAEDVFNPEVIEDLMFDESFGRSKLYFTTLQMLRVFSDVISETRRELQYLSVHHYNKEIYYQLSEYWDAKTDVEGLIASWERILSLQEAAEKKLLDRIASKTVEIESLRDGVCLQPSILHTCLILFLAVQRNFCARGLTVNLDEPRCDCIHNRHSHLPSCKLHCCTYRHPSFLSQFSLLISPI